MFLPGLRSHLHVHLCRRYLRSNHATDRANPVMADSLDSSRSASRRVAGYLSKRNGQAFEEIFQLVCRQNRIACTRIPDGCRSIGRNRLMRVKTPFDWVISHDGKSAMIDTKSTLAGTFPHSAIDRNQVKAMMEHCLVGVLAGYVIATQKNHQVFFIPATILIELSFQRGSISAQDQDRNVIPLGPLTTFNPKLIFQTG